MPFHTKDPTFIYKGLKLRIEHNTEKHEELLRQEHPDVLKDANSVAAQMLIKHNALMGAVAYELTQLYANMDLEPEFDEALFIPDQDDDE